MILNHNVIDKIAGETGYLTKARFFYALNLVEKNLFRIFAPWMRKNILKPQTYVNYE